MSKKSYLIFYPDGTVEKVKRLDPEICQNAEDGQITIVDPKSLKYRDCDGHWEEIPNYEKEDEEEDDFDEEEEDDFI